MNTEKETRLALVGLEVSSTTSDEDEPPVDEITDGALVVGRGAICGVEVIVTTVVKIDTTGVAGAAERKVIVVAALNTNQ